MLEYILINTVILTSAIVPHRISQPTGDILANSCKEFIVISADGYTNVRSTPEITKNTINIVGVLITGTKIEISTKDRDWIKINLPIPGFISKGQITSISCNKSTALLMKVGLPTVTQLGKQAAQGNYQAAKTLIKISRGTDGILSEFYGFTIADWADKNPTFLISMLKEESAYIYEPFLYLLSYEMGKSQRRKNFEKNLAKLLPGNPMINFLNKVILDEALNSID